MPDYRRAKLYKIVNDVDEKIYIGSTTVRYLSQRLASHRHEALRSNTALSRHMKKLGQQHFRIVWLKDVPCHNRDQLEAMHFEAEEEYDPRVLLKARTVKHVPADADVMRCKQVHHMLFGFKRAKLLVAMVALSLTPVQTIGNPV